MSNVVFQLKIGEIDRGDLLLVEELADNDSFIVLSLNALKL